MHAADRFRPALRTQAVEHALFGVTIADRGLLEVRVIDLAVDVDLEEEADRPTQELDALGTVVQAALEISERSLKGLVDFLLVQAADLGRRGDPVLRIVLHLHGICGGLWRGFAAAAGGERK